MPYWTCKKCGKVYNYAKNDKPPKCKCKGVVKSSSDKKEQTDKEQTNKEQTENKFGEVVSSKASQGNLGAITKAENGEEIKYFKKSGVEGKKVFLKK